MEPRTARSIYKGKKAYQDEHWKELHRFQKAKRGLLRGKKKDKLTIVYRNKLQYNILRWKGVRVVKTDSMRQKMYGRGANIQNLNQQTLSSLDIPVPSKAMQEQFADFVIQVNKSKLAIQKALNETQLLFDKLMQDYFG